MEQFFTSFVSQFRAHLVSSLEKKSKVTMADIDDCLANFEFKAGEISGKKSGSRVCEYMITDKLSKQPRQCTSKNAKNEHEGKWYCGSAEKGHYHSVLNATQKESKKTEKETTSKSSKSAKAEAATKAVDVLKEKVIKEKAAPSKVISEKRIIKVGSLELACVNGIYYETTHRIVIDKDTKIAKGVLKEDNKTIVPLKESHIRFLQANNIKYETVKSSKKKAVSSDDESEEEKPAKSAKSSKKTTKVESDESEEEPSVDLSESEDDNTPDIEEEDEGDIGDEDESEEESEDDDD